MAYTAKSDRKRVSLYEFMGLFNTEQKAMEYFETRRWSNNRVCPYCNGSETRDASHATMPYWCKPCRKYFSVRVGTLMVGSHISYRQWLMAIYLMNTSLKGVSSTKIANDISVTQKTGWFLEHRIREAWGQNASTLLEGMVEVDEAYIGGKEHNKHECHKMNAGRGSVGKTPVIGLKSRGGGVRAVQVAETDKPTLNAVVRAFVKKGSTVYTDQYPAYNGLEKDYRHEVVAHSAGEYVKGQAHINGIESFWALLKRGIYGTYHNLSEKHLQRYIDEFSGRHNLRRLDTMNQIDLTLDGLVGKRLTYRNLTTN